MKTILTFAFVAFLAITTSAVATDVHPSYTQGTTTSCFSYFRVHRQQNGAGMMWAVNHTDVTDFKIERSDKEVFPGYIHYRITALRADGSTEQSTVEMIRIVSRK